MKELQFSETQRRQKLKFEPLVLKHSADPDTLNIPRYPEHLKVTAAFEIVNHSTFFFLSYSGVTSQPSLIYFYILSFGQTLQPRRKENCELFQTLKEF